MIRALKWMLIIGIAIAILGFSISLAEYSGTCGSLKWDLSDDGDLIISGSGEMSSFTYSSTDAWKPYAASIKSVTINEGVTSISSHAFRSCQKLVSITIPHTVTYIGDSAFSNCNSLMNISIPSSVTVIATDVFSDCNNLTYITIPNGVTSIGTSAFSGCSSLMSISIPDSVTSIGGGCFSDCNSLSKILIPDRITHIGGWTFSGCSNLMSINIPDGVISIGNHAFNNCVSLSNISIPDSVTSIGTGAFAGCSSLTSITIPDGITSISDSTFAGCSGLTCIMIPIGVTSIGDYAFSGCNSLSSFSIPYGITNVGNGTFFGCNSLISILIPDSVTSIGACAFYSCSSLSSIFIPDSVTRIDNEAFSKCSSLTSVTIPNGVKSISNQTFYCCSSLTSITIPDCVTTIGDYAFLNCSSLTAITIPDSVISIGKAAFSGCENLEKMILLATTTAFGSNVISHYEKTTIYCYEYTDADSWTRENGYMTVYLDYYDPDSERSVTVPENTIQLAVNAIKTVSPIVFPDYDNPSVIWLSNDPNIVTVQNGVLKGISVGKTVITVIAGSASANIDVNVFLPATSMRFVDDEIWTVAKEPLELLLIMEPDNAEASLVWTSSDISIAEVGETNSITTKKPGDVTITVTSDNGISADTILHVCYPVTAIEFEETAIAVKPGVTVQLTANVSMRTQSCVNHLVTFASSNPSVAIVSDIGLVTAISVGKTIVTATATSGVIASCSIIVPSATFSLPASTAIIESEAFANLPGEIVFDLPDSVQSIANDAFTGSNISIAAPASSYAEAWAQKHGISFITK